MEIRKLKPEEHGDTRPVYEENFPEDSRGFVDYYYAEKTKDNTIFVAEEDGAIRSMVHLNPYTLKVNGKEELSHYIVAVATEKAYRRRGYMAKLLETSLQEMYGNGEPFTFLMPASENIYLPHGFRTVCEQNRRYYQKEDAKVEENGASWRKAKTEDAARIAEYAGSQLMERYQVYADRTAAYYERLMKEYESDGGCLMVREEQGTITGCLPKVPSVDGGTPKIMARVMDARKMLMLLDLNYLMAVCFHVTDPLIPENNRCLLLTGTEFSGVMLMEGKEENSEGTLTIAALTRLAFGAGTVEDIAEEEGVSMSERMKGELKKIVPLSRIFLNEVV